MGRFLFVLTTPIYTALLDVRQYVIVSKIKK